MIPTSRSKLIYEIGISILAAGAVAIALADITGRIDSTTSPLWYNVDLGILIVFATDYFVRLFLATEKKRFIRQNIFDLIAIIPFNSFFRAFRMARLVRLTRLVKLTKLAKVAIFAKRLEVKAEKFLKTNGLIYILYVTIAVILIGSIGIYAVEQGSTVDTFADAVWWSFVTATTVGYGDISPSTGLGRIIASILMLTGIGCIGMLTGTIATFFIKPEKIRISDFDDLSDSSKAKINSYIDFLRRCEKESITFPDDEMI